LAKIAAAIANGDGSRASKVLCATYRQNRRGVRKFQFAAKNTKNTKTPVSTISLVFFVVRPRGSRRVSLVVQKKSSRLFPPRWAGCVFLWPFGGGYAALSNSSQSCMTLCPQIGDTFGCRIGICEFRRFDENDRLTTVPKFALVGLSEKEKNS
jgi:hypothetical protein